MRVPENQSTATLGKHTTQEIEEYVCACVCLQDSNRKQGIQVTASLLQFISLDTQQHTQQPTPSLHTHKDKRLERERQLTARAKVDTKQVTANKNTLVYITGCSRYQLNLNALE